MQSIFLETRTRKVSLVFLPRDNFAGGAIIYSNLEVILDGVIQKPIHTYEGYIIYMDLPEGEYNVTVNSTAHTLYETFTVDTETYDPLTGVIELPVEPKPDYDFPDDASLVRGTVNDQLGVPIERAKVQVVDAPSFVLTDAMGRYVHYFNPSLSTKDIVVKVTADGYQDQLIDVTVIKNDTVFINAVLVKIDDSAIALISGTVLSYSGDAVTQATVEIQGTGISTLTNAHGKVFLARQLPSMTENVTLIIRQDGYLTTSVPLTLTRQQTTEFVTNMNLQILSYTCELEVTVVYRYYHYYHYHENYVEGALVEVLEKNRSGYTNESKGRVVFYHNSILDGGENVTVRVSKEGYPTRVTGAFLRSGKETKLRICLGSC